MSSDPLPTPPSNPNNLVVLSDDSHEGSPQVPLHSLCPIQRPGLSLPTEKGKGNALPSPLHSDSTEEIDSENDYTDEISGYLPRNDQRVQSLIPYKRPKLSGTEPDKRYFYEITQALVKNQQRIIKQVKELGRQGRRMEKALGGLKQKSHDPTHEASSPDFEKQEQASAPDSEIPVQSSPSDIWTCQCQHIPKHP